MNKIRYWTVKITFYAWLLSIASIINEYVLKIDRVQPALTIYITFFLYGVYLEQNKKITFG
jgi:hypothetical protein